MAGEPYDASKAPTRSVHRHRMGRLPRARPRPDEAGDGGPVVVDLRNIYEPADMRSRGFAYTSIGRG
jgi:hypothetical protein